MFFPHQAARDLTMAALVGVLLAALAWKGAPPLEAPADPTSSNYIPRPEWYFLGLFQLLKYFPGRWEVIGALVIPRRGHGLARAPAVARSRPLARGAAAAGGAGAVYVRTRGHYHADGARRARYAAGECGAVEYQEIGGAAMVAASDRCTRCHRADGLAAPVEPGHISNRPIGSRCTSRTLK
jgi:hypothetical protein